MHFGLTDEQELLQQTLRDFAASQLSPALLRKIFDGGTGCDESLWRGVAEIGALGLVVPERFGGAELELLDLALVFEILGEAAMPGPFLGHVLAELALLLAGSPEQQERWLPSLASGEAIGALAIAENGDAWEPGSWSLELEAGALRGAKHWVEHAGTADLVVVGLRGGQLALVEGTGPGLRAEPIEALDRTRALARLQFDGAPAERLPGDRAAAERLADAGRILLAADALGAAGKLIQMTVEYLRTREQFGTRLAQFQGIKHQLANLAAETEPLRGLVWYAAHAWDHLPDELPRAAAAAKAHVTDRATDVGRAAIELHGGIGFTWDCDVHFWAKRAAFDRTWLGSPRAHRERLADLEGW